MSGSMAVGANYLSFTAGSAAAAGSGAYTVAALVQPATGNNNMGVAALLASGSRVRSFFEDNLKLFGEGDFIGFGTLVQGQWYVLVESKAAGSAQPYTFDVWPYDPVNFTGTMSTGTGQSVNDGSAVDEIRFGQAINPSNGLYAVLSIWNRQLSLGERQSLRTNRLADWAGVAGGAPAELISLENWTGSSGAQVLIGSSTFSAVTGTVSSGSNPPSFDFALSTTVNATANLTAAPTLTAGGTVTTTAAATLAASPTLTAAATPIRPATVSLAAAPTLTADATATTSAGAALTAVPVLTVAGHAELGVAAVLSAAPTLHASAAEISLIVPARFVRMRATRPRVSFGTGREPL